MRTNIIIDEQLIEEVQSLYGFRTKKKAVEEGLKVLLRLKAQEKIREYRGQLNWEGDLEAQRMDR